MKNLFIFVTFQSEQKSCNGFQPLKINFFGAEFFITFALYLLRCCLMLTEDAVAGVNNLNLTSERKFFKRLQILIPGNVFKATTGLNVIAQSERVLNKGKFLVRKAENKENPQRLKKVFRTPPSNWINFLKGMTKTSRLAKTATK